MRTGTTTDPAPYRNLDLMSIAGEWRPGYSGETRADVDPWSGETLVEIPLASTDDLDDAYTAAEETQPAWAAAPPAERATVLHSAAAIMQRRRDEILGWLVRETGGTIAKAELECDLVRAGMLEAARHCHDLGGRVMPSDVPGKESRVYREPVGVVAVISPWNFPMQLSNRSVAMALAVGNGVVLKPASDTPVTGAILLARIYEEAGLPPGLLNVVIGSGSEIGDRIVEHRAARVVSFTGSSPVGERITRKAGIKNLALELGGNGPFIVLDDANLGRAVDAAVFGSFFHAGQICMIANRIIVEAGVHDDFVARFCERARALTVGDPRDPCTDIGPVMNKRQLDSIQDKLRRARNEGASQLLGGDPFGPTGLALPVHVLLGTNHVTTAQEEVFGPVITILKARDADDAVMIANDTDYGLSSAVFTGDAARGESIARRIDAGMTHIDDSPVNDDANTAFGGVKDSGIGRFGGRWAVEEFTTDHWISVQREPREYPI